MPNRRPGVKNVESLGWPEAVLHRGPEHLPHQAPAIQRGLWPQSVAAEVGEYTAPQEQSIDLLRRLEDRSLIPPEIARLFHGLRKAGNAATHSLRGDRSEAHHQLWMAWYLAIWFHRTFGKEPGFKPPTFVTSRDPRQIEQDAEEERSRRDAGVQRSTSRSDDEF